MEEKDIDNLRQEGDYIEAMMAYHEFYRPFSDFDNSLNTRSRFGVNYKNYLNARRLFAYGLQANGKYDEALQTYRDIIETLTSIHNYDRLAICEIEICMLDLSLKLRNYDDASTLVESIQSNLNSFSESFKLCNRQSVVQDYWRGLRMFICMMSVLGRDAQITSAMECVLGRMKCFTDEYKTSLYTYQGRYQYFLDVLGPWHPLMLNCCLGLASLLRYLCHFTEAFLILEDLQANRRKKFDSRDFHFQSDIEASNEGTQRIEYEIGNCLYAEGSYGKALIIYKSICDSEYSKRDGRLTLNARRMIGKIGFKRDGDGKRVIQTLRDVYTIQMRENSQRRDALITLSDIAEIQRELGEYDEAEKTYRKMSNMSKSLNCPECELIDIEIKSAMILAYKCPEEAVTKFRELQKKCKSIDNLGQSLICSLNNVLATAFNEQENYSAAIQMYIRIIDMKERVLSHHHRDTLNMKHSLGQCYFASRQYKEALSTYKDVRDLRYAILHPYHPDCLSVDYSIAEVHEVEGRLEEAFKIYCDLYDKAIVCYTADHPEISKFKSKMCNVARVKESSNLIIATEKGDLNHVIRYIRSLGEDVNTRSKNGSTALHIACQKSHVDIFRYLLSAGANYEIKNWESKTPYNVANNSLIKKELQLLKEFFLAFRMGKVCKSGDVIFHTAILNARDRSGLTLLYFASYKGYVEFVKKLLDKGADFHGSEKSGQTALHAAILGSKYEVLKVLLDHLKNKKAADFENMINHKNNTKGETPLHFSAHKNVLGLVKLLLDNGADRSIKNKLGRLPVDLARDKEIKRILRVDED